MGKKKHEKKSAPKLSKKEQKKLEAKIAAERERKAAKKSAKKTKRSDREADAALEAAAAVKERAKPLKGEALKAAMEADIAAAKLRKKEADDALDAEIKARLEAKRAARNSTDPEAPGSAERLAKVQLDVATARAERHEETVSAGVTTDTGAAVDEAIAEAKKSKKTKTVEVDGKKVAETTHVELAPEPEAPAPIEFANPSDLPVTDYETNGLNQYIVKRPSDGKEVGYTRVTTYIACLEDTKKLTEWKMRLLLEGVAAAEEPDEDGKSDPVTARVRDLMHNRDLAIAKARKQDRKGKLHTGQLATLVDAAYGDFKKAMNVLVDELFELGGGREAATKGTDLHALTEVRDTEGIQAVNVLLDEGKITPADFADIEAYDRIVTALGGKFTAMEQTVVNHDLKVAGRLDRVILVKLPEIRNAKGEVIYAGDTRARRYVWDLKTGRVDFGQGKIAQQLRMYADSEAYDLETQETSSHGANRTHGLLLHLPAGSAQPRLYVVDLGTGAVGNKLAGEVRSFRNTGKRAYDLTADAAAQILSPTE